MTFVNAQTNRAESNVDDRSNTLVGSKYNIKQDESRKLVGFSTISALNSFTKGSESGLGALRLMIPRCLTIIFVSDLCSGV